MSRREITVWVSAPKARNVIAWDNAPGKLVIEILEALKARHEGVSDCVANIISRLQR